MDSNDVLSLLVGSVAGVLLVVLIQAVIVWLKVRDK